MNNFLKNPHPGEILLRDFLEPLGMSQKRPGKRNRDPCKQGG